MKLEKDLYFNKKILIYGLGISGISSFNNLKKNNSISCFDDNLKNLKNTVFKNYIISKKTLIKLNLII